MFRVARTRVAATAGARRAAVAGAGLDTVRSFTSFDPSSPVSLTRFVDVAGVLVLREAVEAVRALPLVIVWGTGSDTFSTFSTTPASSSTSLAPVAGAFRREEDREGVLGSIGAGSFANPLLPGQELRRRVCWIDANIDFLSLHLHFHLSRRVQERSVLHRDKLAYLSESGY